MTTVPNFFSKFRLQSQTFTWKFQNFKSKLSCILQLITFPKRYLALKSTNKWLRYRQKKVESLRFPIQTKLRKTIKKLWFYSVLARFWTFFWWYLSHLLADLIIWLKFGFEILKFSCESLAPKSKFAEKIGNCGHIFLNNFLMLSIFLGHTLLLT